MWLQVEKVTLEFSVADLCQVLLYVTYWLTATILVVWIKDLKLKTSSCILKSSLWTNQRNGKVVECLRKMKWAYVAGGSNFLSTNKLWGKDVLWRTGKGTLCYIWSQLFDWMILLVRSFGTWTWFEIKNFIFNFYV